MMTENDINGRIEVLKEFARNARTQDPPTDSEITIAAEAAIDLVGNLLLDINRIAHAAVMLAEHR